MSPLVYVLADHKQGHKEVNNGAIKLLMSSTLSVLVFVKADGQDFTHGLAAVIENTTCHWKYDTTAAHVFVFYFSSTNL